MRLARPSSNHRSAGPAEATRWPPAARDGAEHRTPMKRVLVGLTFAAACAGPPSQAPAYITFTPADRPAAKTAEADTAFLTELREQDAKMIAPHSIEMPAFPLPTPANVRGFRLRALFDVDDTGKILSVTFRASPNADYNKKIE